MRQLGLWHGLEDEAGLHEDVEEVVNDRLRALRSGDDHGVEVRDDQAVVAHGVTIFGPTNLPATVPYHASFMYARNVTTFLTHLVKDKQLVIAADDEITRETLVTRDGQVVHERIKGLL